ncbi:MAG: gamma-glutamyl-gamma-aminobutyrate hydrolase family protein [Melioribacteraceae bacterium]|nr:gamma-glutamyl-gamma-aminobutyrate hydrolase family protein [Melioribacteraceae bacterium]
MLLIIDNQSSFIKKFKRNFLAEQDFDYVFFDHNQPIVLSAKTEISGIILSGGKGNPYEPLNLTANFVAMMNFDVPTIGFCLGHEILAVAHRGRIKKLPEYTAKKEEIRILKPEDPIFNGISDETIFMTRRHSFHVAEIPPDFESLAESSITPNEIIKHKEKPIYGFQSHPEVSGKEGILMIKNFLHMCGLL